MATYSLNLVHAHTAHALILELVGNNHRVLEIGCSSGYMSEYFTKAGCTVTAIELDRDQAEKARRHCRRVIVGSAEDDAVLRSVEGTYDVIVCADVLEHLRDPAVLLNRLQHYLADNGHLVVSVPNIANWKIRFNLLRGKFDYAAEGIMDRTHLRFFTIRSARALLAETGYSVERFVPAATRMPGFLVSVLPSLFAVHLLFKARKRIA